MKNYVKGVTVRATVVIVTVAAIWAVHTVQEARAAYKRATDTNV